MWNGLWLFLLVEPGEPGLGGARRAVFLTGDRVGDAISSSSSKSKRSWAGFFFGAGLRLAAAWDLSFFLYD